MLIKFKRKWHELLTNKQKKTRLIIYAFIVNDCQQAKIFNNSNSTQKFELSGFELSGFYTR